ncbi:MAG TPA: cytochrome b/b6 domain-containing protein [Bacteroidales bacterium]|jgi:thiosulfate reductase cytochrome b subunit|nr:cytochrome b/b6 domain-containing protein [Bacteroidales bacterium]HPE43422.1 cytochrome b/b6 domain-containing protein [Bacteroidales bacterium]
MSKRIYLYPIWLRFWHAINALMFLILLATGLSMQYSNPDWPLIRFDLAVQFHNIAGIIVSFNYLIFLLGNLTTSNGAYYKINWKTLISDLIKQMNYYLFGVFKKQATPFPVNEERKFNPLQKFTYVLTMYGMMPVIIITGLALLFPELIIEKVFQSSGIFLTALLHTVIGFMLSMFLVIHVYFSTMGSSPVSNFKSMINGYHEPH